MSRHIHVHLHHQTRDGLAGQLVGTAVKAARKLNDAFEEGKHPRGKGGKFGPLSSVQSRIHGELHTYLKNNPHSPAGQIKNDFGSHYISKHLPDEKVVASHLNEMVKRGTVSRKKFEGAHYYSAK
jgi:hypothetical protein